MQITDTIADMLTRIRNANSVRHDRVNVPASRVKKAIAKILLDEGLINDYRVVEDGKQGVIKIELKYLNSRKDPVLLGLERVSKPGLRKYYDCKSLPKVMRGLGVAIVSTSKGIMTDKAARKAGVGGEVLAFVW